MEHAKRGEAALERSDALSAAASFTKALVEHPTSPDYFTQRSTAFARFKPPRYDLALRDAEYAVLLGQKRQKRDKIQAAQQRRVVSLYGLNRYEESKEILDSMLRWRPKDSKRDKMEHDMWMAKITSKLEGEEGDGQTAHVKEYPDINLPDEKSMKLWLKSQLKDDGTFNEGSNEDPNSTATTTNDQKSDLDSEDQAGVLSAKAEDNITTKTVQKAQPVRHDWYQDTNIVTITFYAKRVDKTKLHSSFKTDYVEVRFPHPDDSNETFNFTLDPTFASIDASASIAKATGAKVELKLAKQEKGFKWAALDNRDRPKSDKLPSAWTTKGGEDWNKKAAAITAKPPKKAKKPEDGEQDSDADSDDVGDPVDGFFKKLYAGSDADTRRAMMKSFQESNGTALSTNWSEVSKGKVEEARSKDD